VAARQATACPAGARKNFLTAQNMKRKLQFIAGVSAASFLAFSAPAQNTPDPATDGQTGAAYDLAGSKLQDRLQDAAEASEIIGMTVKNHQNEKLGKVVDFAVDVESGRIVEVILSRGGFLGMDETYTAVPPEALVQNAGHRGLLMDASAEKIEDGSRFDFAKWNLCTQASRVTEVYGYYGLRPYFVPEHGEYRTNSADGIFASSLPRNSDGTINTAGGRTVDAVHNQEIARDLEETNNPVLTQYPEGTWTTNHLTHDNGTVSTWSSLVYVQQAGRLMGQPVTNLQGVKLGKVENFMMDLSAGRITAVIIASGGFIGMADKLSAVPPSELRYNAEHQTLQLDSSKAMLAGAPRFKPND
jgi:sporulation protein YlmC with PRC-barrel domain